MGIIWSKDGREINVKAKLRPGHQRNISAGFDKRLQMRGNLRRRKLVEPCFVAGCLELPFLDCVIEDKTGYSIYQRGNDAHLRNDGSPSDRSDRRLAQDRVVFFEGTVGSLGCRSQRVQLPIAFRASGDFQNKPRMLCNGNMRRITKQLRTMGTVSVKIEIGRKLGFNALLETGERKPLSSRVKSIRSRGQMAIRNIRPAIPVIASIKESFPNQLFISRVVID